MAQARAIRAPVRAPSRGGRHALTNVMSRKTARFCAALKTSAPLARSATVRFSPASPTKHTSAHRSRRLARPAAALPRAHDGVTRPACAIPTHPHPDASRARCRPVLRAVAHACVQRAGVPCIAQDGRGAAFSKHRAPEGVLRAVAADADVWSVAWVARGDRARRAGRRVVEAFAM